MDGVMVKVVSNVENNVDGRTVEVVSTVENNVDWTVDDELDAGGTIGGGTTGGVTSGGTSGGAGGTTGGTGGTPGKSHGLSESSRVHLAIVPVLVAFSTAAELSVKNLPNSWASAGET